MYITEDEKEALQIYDFLLDTEICTPEEICLVTKICGESLDTYESILYQRTGYRSLDQFTDNE